jgi:hypothetical protein
LMFPELLALPHPTRIRPNPSKRATASFLIDEKTP